MNSSVIDKDHYRDALPFLLFLVNSSVVLQYYTTSVIHEYGADAFFKEKMTGQLSFCNDFILGEQILCKNFSSLPAMKYNRFCAVPYRAFCFLQVEFLIGA